MNDPSIPFVAGKLRDYAEPLRHRSKRKGEPGMGEMRRAAYLLLLGCHEEKCPPPQELLDLMKLVLGLADKDIVANIGKKTSEAWGRAVEFESRHKMLSGDAPCAASVNSVARYAFKDDGDHRKTIREWRSNPNYQTAVFNLRAMREVSGLDVIDGMRRYGPTGTNPLSLLFGLPNPD